MSTAAQTTAQPNDVLYVRDAQEKSGERRLTCSLEIEAERAKNPRLRKRQAEGEKGADLRLEGI